MAFIHAACLDPKCLPCGQFWDHRLGLNCGDSLCDRCNPEEDEDDDWMLVLDPL